MSEIVVKGKEIKYQRVNDEDYICITDIAKYKSDEPDSIIANWMRNRNTVEFLGIWETLNNPNSNPLEFEGIRKQAGLNAFLLSPKNGLKPQVPLAFLPKLDVTAELMRIRILLLSLLVGYR